MTLALDKYRVWTIFRVLKWTSDMAECCDSGQKILMMMLKLPGDNSDLDRSLKMMAGEMWNKCLVFTKIFACMLSKYSSEVVLWSLL